MNWIDINTKESFGESFGLNEILENSIFYPASGIDTTHIKTLSECVSLVHIDYSVPENEVKRDLNEAFRGVRYKLIGLRHIAESELTPNGFAPNNFPLKDSEKDRMDFMNKAKSTHKPFCFWAIYEITETLTAITTGKVEKFSLLHIGGEACATFNALYVSNNINPKAVATLIPSEGCGDNWTKFTDPEYRLFRLMQLNSEKNSVNLPE